MSQKLRLIFRDSLRAGFLRACYTLQILGVPALYYFCDPSYGAIPSPPLHFRLPRFQLSGRRKIVEPTYVSHESNVRTGQLLRAPSILVRDSWLLGDFPSLANPSPKVKQCTPRVHTFCLPSATHVHRMCTLTSSKVTNVVPEDQTPEHFICRVATSQ